MRARRSAVRQGHRPQHLVALGTGHDLQVHVAAEVVLLAQDGPHVEDRVLAAAAAAHHAR